MAITFINAYCQAATNLVDRFSKCPIEMSATTIMTVFLCWNALAIADLIAVRNFGEMLCVLERKYQGQKNTSTQGQWMYDIRSSAI